MMMNGEGGREIQPFWLLILFIILISAGPWPSADEFLC
jgi:hypothetical protein